jgi:hypothetical protein
LLKLGPEAIKKAEKEVECDQTRYFTEAFQNPDNRKTTLTRTVAEVGNKKHEKAVVIKERKEL